LEERREQFECSYCGQKFNFKKDAEDHERTCPQRDRTEREAKRDEIRRATVSLVFQTRHSATLNVSPMQHEITRA